MTRRIRLALAILALLAGTGLADLWKRYEGARATSPDGRNVLVVDPGERPRTTSWRLSRDGEEIGSGSLDWEPFEVRVLDGAPAALLLEHWGGIGRGPVIARLEADGSLAYRHDLLDLFTEEKADGFPRSESSTWWFEGFFVDEPSGRVVFAVKGGGCLAVDLATGESGETDDSALLPVLVTGLVEDRVKAFDVAAARRPDGLGAAARAVAGDSEEPRSVRLRALVAAHAAGEDLPFATIVYREALDRDGVPEFEAQYAMEHLVPILRERAGPILRIACRRGHRGTADALDAYGRLGSVALPALRAIEEDEALLEDWRALARAAARAARGE